MILFDEGYGPAWDARLRLDELSPVEALRVDSRTAEAVRAALLIALTCLGRGDEPQAFGWVGSDAPIPT